MTSWSLRLIPLLAKTPPAPHFLVPVPCCPPSAHLRLPQPTPFSTIHPYRLISAPGPLHLQLLQGPLFFFFFSWPLGLQILGFFVFFNPR